VLLPRQQAKLVRGAKDKEHEMSETPNTAIGIDIGKYTFHAVGHNARGEPGGLSHEVSFAPVNGHHQANRSGPKSAQTATSRDADLLDHLVGGD
jgi:hypothetical protein